MDLQTAAARLHGRDDWNAILEYLEKERESCLGDFQDPERLENPQALARLAGEISAFDRILRNLTYDDSREDSQ
jgi:hypothetical protein